MFLIVGKAVDKLITVSSPLNLLLALVFQRIVSLESLRAQTSLEQSSLGSELSKENDCQTQSHLRRTGSVTCAFHQRDGVHPGGGVLVTILIVTSRPSGTNPWLTLFIWKEETVQLKDLNVLFCPHTEAQMPIRDVTPSSDHPTLTTQELHGKGDEILCSFVDTLRSFNLILKLCRHCQ